MKYGQDGFKLTESFEQCRLEAYPDPGTGGEPWTIGWGHTAGVSEGDTCSQEQADAWLAEDVQSAEDTVNRVVTVPLTQEEFDALVDFAFNVGNHALESSTLLRLLNAGDYDAAADQLERWDMSAGRHMAGLLRRRRAEHDLFESAQ